VTVGQDLLRVCVRDDGRGGADVTGGSGLAGLRDRVEALGGRLALHSPPGAGTTLQVQLPVEPGCPPAAGAAGPGTTHSTQAVPP
jgi:signal transduction histidine kinase